MRDKLKSYSESGAYPFHMPGHKRKPEDADFPFSLDITEIDGFDNLHCPEGCIKELEDSAAALYHAKRAFLLVNGATGGILSAIKAMTRRGDHVVIARNCHTSVHHAAELLGLKLVYLLPDPPTGERAYHCCGDVNPYLLDILLGQHPDATLFVMTSPTYEGICSDIAEISAVCRRHGVRLLVDEAHGAHFPFHNAFPANAVSCGADCAVVSLHKTMPALTQTALLLMNDSGLEPELQSALSLFQTSSPSYVLMCSIEYALSYAQRNPGEFERYIRRLSALEKRLSGLQKLSLLFHDGEEMLANCYDYDRGKLVISAYKADISGITLANILRKKYNIEVEMAARDYIIAMTSVCDTDEGFDRLAEALLQIDSCCGCAEKNAAPFFAALPERRFYPYECEEKKKRWVQLSEAVGQVVTEDIFAYPPGIPLLVKGEVMSGALLRLIKDWQSEGVNLQAGGRPLSDAVPVADL